MSAFTIYLLASPFVLAGFLLGVYWFATRYEEQLNTALALIVLAFMRR